MIFPGLSPHSTKRVFPIAVGRGMEKYENLSVLFGELSPILEKIRHLTWQSKKGATITPEFWFCADAKFLLLVLGMQAANSEFSCPFCLLSHTLWGKTIVENIYNPSDYLRHSMHALDICKISHRNCPSHNEHGCKISKHGWVRRNLIQNFIELDEIVIDELHLFMRQWDIHLDFLIAYCEAHHIENMLEGIFFSFIN